MANTVMNLRQRVTARACASLMALVAGCGGAATAPQPQSFSAVQAEGRHNDGAIRKALQASWEGVVRSFDANGDGAIGKIEAPWAPLTFADLDANGDERLTVDETALPAERLAQMAEVVHAAFSRIFHRADRNQDGRLTRGELDGAEELAVFQDTPAWRSLLAEYDPGSAPFSQQRFESYVMDLLQRTDIQRQQDPPAASGRTPVLLIQGYLEPSWYFMSGLYLYLKKKQWPAYAINLFPNVGDIGEQAKLVQRKIEEIRKQTGARRVHLVVHSMGGLISRYYIQKLGGADSVDRLVTVATPHYGTVMALAGIGRGARQMEPGSDFLQDLNAGGGMVAPVRYTSIWSPTDEIVVPASSAQLKGSDVKPPVTLTEHLLILFDKRTYEHVWNTLTANR